MGPGAVRGARTVLLRARSSSSRTACSLAAFSSTATGVWGCEPQPHLHPLSCSLCRSDCSGVCTDMLYSPFWLFVCHPCSSAGRVFNPVRPQSRGLREPADIVITQRPSRSSPVLLTELVKSAHPVCDEELWYGSRGDCRGFSREANRARARSRPRILISMRS